MREKIQSIAEISDIERAYRQGAPALGYAATEFMRRWRYPLHDPETFLRLVFLYMVR